MKFEALQVSGRILKSPQVVEEGDLLSHPISKIVILTGEKGVGVSEFCEDVMNREVVVVGDLSSSISLDEVYDRPILFRSIDRHNLSDLKRLILRLLAISSSRWPNMFFEIANWHQYAHEFDDVSNCVSIVRPAYLTPEDVDIHVLGTFCTPESLLDITFGHPFYFRSAMEMIADRSVTSLEDLDKNLRDSLDHARFSQGVLNSLHRIFPSDFWRAIDNRQWTLVKILNEYQRLILWSSGVITFFNGHWTFFCSKACWDMYRVLASHRIKE